MRATGEEAGDNEERQAGSGTDSKSSGDCDHGVGRSDRRDEKAFSARPWQRNLFPDGAAATRPPFWSLRCPPVAGTFAAVAEPISPAAPPAPAASPTRTFWQRRFRDPVIAQLTQGITPEKIALTLAIGSSCALFPIIGTTTLLCFLVALLLRLNQPIIQLLNQVLWPVQVSAIFACVHLGETVTGAPRVSFSLTRMSQLFWDSPVKFFNEFGATALHAVVGWTLVAPFYIAAVYYLTRPILRTVNRLRTEAAVRAATGPDHPTP